MKAQTQAGTDKRPGKDAAYWLGFHGLLRLLSYTTLDQHIQGCQGAPCGVGHIMGFQYTLDKWPWESCVMLLRILLLWKGLLLKIIILSIKFYFFSSWDHPAWWKGCIFWMEMDLFSELMCSTLFWFTEEILLMSHLFLCQCFCSFLDCNAVCWIC